MRNLIRYQVGEGGSPNCPSRIQAATRLNGPRTEPKVKDSSKRDSEGPNSSGSRKVFVSSGHGDFVPRALESLTREEFDPRQDVYSIQAPEAVQRDEARGRESSQKGEGAAKHSRGWGGRQVHMTLRIQPVTSGGWLMAISMTAET